MEPLSLSVRRLYAALFFVLFIILLPIITLYASGYRLSGFSLVPTGGIYVSVPASDFQISINGEPLGRSGLFSHSFFFDNLAPASYVVQASAEGYYPWSKTLVVESRVVSDAQPLAIRQPLIVRELSVATSSNALPESATSTVRAVSRAEITDIRALFAATSTDLGALPGEENLTPRIVADEGAGALLIIEGGNLFLRWEEKRSPPSSFCIRPSNCQNVFALEAGDESVTDAAFFAGGVVYRTRESGVYFTEADIREPRLVIAVFTKADTAFRIIGGTLFIESEDSIFEVVGF